MPEIPYEQLLQAQLGTLIAVFGIILLIVIGLTVMFVGVPLMRLLSRLADNTQTAQRDAQTALAGAQAAQTALASAGTALTAALAENTSEIKTQTGVLTSLKLELHAQIEASGKVMAARLDAHDQLAREGVARLEAQGARLIEMVESGQKVSRAELAQLSRDILAAIHSLTPPQPPPVALRVEPNPAKEGNAA